MTTLPLRSCPRPSGQPRPTPVIFARRLAWAIVGLAVALAVPDRIVARSLGDDAVDMRPPHAAGAVTRPPTGTARIAAPAAARGAAAPAQAASDVAWIGAAGGHVTAVVTADGLVYAAIGPRVEVFRAGAETVRLGRSAPLPGRIHALAAAGGIVTAAVGDAGLWVVDARDPARPVRAGQADLGGRVGGVGMLAGRAFASVGGDAGGAPAAALVIVDVADPAAPRETGRAAFRGRAGAVDVAGSHAYVVAGLPADAGPMAELPELRVFDVSGQAPVRTVTVPDVAAVDAADGRMAALDGRAEHLVAFDLTDPAAPMPLGRVALPQLGARGAGGGRHAVALAGDAAFALRDPGAGGAGDLTAVDMRDPRALVLAGSAPRGGAGVVEAGGLVFVVAGPGGLMRLDPRRVLGQPLMPHASAPWPQARAAVIAGGRAYLASGGRGLRIVDLADPGLAVVGAIDDQGAFAVAVDGDSAYFSTPASLGGMDIAIADVGQPAAPRSIGRLPLGAGVVDLHVERGLLYAVTDNLGAVPPRTYSLVVADVRDPARPSILSRTVLGSAPGSNAPTDFFARPPLLFVAHGALRVFDARDPTRPEEVVHYRVDAARFVYGTAQTAVVAVAGASPGVHVLDIRTPDRPSLMRVIDDGDAGPVEALAGDGTLVAVARGAGGLELLDIGDPARPGAAGLWRPGGGGPAAWADIVAVGGGRVLAATGAADKTLWAFHALDPAGPAVDSLYDPPWLVADALGVEGTRAFVASPDGGLQLVDVAAPDDPRVATPPGWAPLVARGLALAGNRAHFLSGDSMRVADVGNAAGWPWPSTYRPAAGPDTPANHVLAAGPALAAGDGLAYVPVHSRDLHGRDGPRRIDVVDTAGAARPRLVVSLPLDGDARVADVALQARALAVASADGLRVVDVGRPLAPFVAWWAARGVDLWDVETLDDAAFALGPGRLYRFSLSDTAADPLVESHALPDIGGEGGGVGRARGLAVARAGWWTHAAFITPAGGIRVYDVTRGAPPRLVAALPPVAGWRPADLHLTGGDLRVLTDEGGLLVLRLPAPRPDPALFRRYLPLAAFDGG